MTGTSRINREVYVRSCGRLVVKFLRPTRQPSDDTSLFPQDTVKIGVDQWLQDQSGRYLFTGPMTVGV
jgi:hypothetical protein